MTPAVSLMPGDLATVASAAGLETTELHTQDGYDWPSQCTDERWPVDKHQPAAPYFREQMQHLMTCARGAEPSGEEVDAAVASAPRRCVLAECSCLRFAGRQQARCGYLYP